MESISFHKAQCDLCGICIEKCPFGAMRVGEQGVEVDDRCKLCGICINICPQKAIRLAKEVGTVDKTLWRDILVFAEQQEDRLHPVTFELIGEARRLAEHVGYNVHVLMIGGAKTAGLAEELLLYGVKTVFVYQHAEFEHFRVDCYTSAAADCIGSLKPSVVLVGATALGRSLAPRLSARFRSGLTADCTALELRPDTDLVQIRPAFGGNIMARILISGFRPQFATVRYKVMERAKRVQCPSGSVKLCPVTEEILRSRIRVLESRPVPAVRSIEEEEILVVAGRGVRDKKGLDLLGELALALGGQLCFTRPMVEAGHGDAAHQIGLSGRTVKPKLILTFGVSGAIQFTACIQSAACIVAVNSNPDAQIFKIAHYCVAEDLYQVAPRLLERIKSSKEG